MRISLEDDSFLKLEKKLRNQEMKIDSKIFKDDPLREICIYRLYVMTLWKFLKEKLF